jgi:hypothetical protein
MATWLRLASVSCQRVLRRAYSGLGGKTVACSHPERKTPKPHAHVIVSVYTYIVSCRTLCHNAIHTTVPYDTSRYSAVGTETRQIKSRRTFRGRAEELITTPIGGDTPWHWRVPRGKIIAKNKLCVPSANAHQPSAISHSESDMAGISLSLSLSLTLSLIDFRLSHSLYLSIYLSHPALNEALQNSTRNRIWYMGMR